MRRFLVSGGLKAGSLLTLSPEESKHAVKSLRLTEGSAIALMDGRGLEAEGRLRSADMLGAVVEIISVREADASLPIEIIQATLKGPKMDWLVEKLTEIGVSDIRLASTKHTVATGEKIDRWQRIAQSAVKQSGNPQIPSIHAAKPLAELLPELGHGLKILLQPGASKGVAELVRENKGQRVMLAVGPEGGFTSEEERYLQEAGFVPAALSRQILRGETAALVAAALAAHSIDF
jgi:16S rRNA (uracil1498-N3)-methyltransferase